MAQNFPNLLPGRAGSWDPNLSVYNLNADTFARWRTALARGRSPAGPPAKVACVGDSTTEGYTCTAPRYLNSYPAKLAGMLQAAYGGPVGDFQHYQALSFETDSRIVNPSPTLTAFTPWYRGPVALGMQGVAGAGIDFTATCDRFLLTYATFTGGGPFAAQIDGVTVSSLTSALGSIAVAQATVQATSLGVHTLRILPTSGIAFIVGVQPLIGNVTTGAQVFRFGHDGARSTDWDSNLDATDRLQSIFTPFAPDVVVVAASVNDHSDGLTLANYKANLQTFLTKAAAQNCDVLLVAQLSGYAGPVAPYAAYVSNLYDLADTNNVPLLDLGRRWGGSQPAANTRGLMTDSVHPNQKGYDDFASAVFAILSQGVGTQPASLITPPSVSAQTLTANGAVTIDASAANTAVITLQANATSSTITNGRAGQLLTINWLQDATGTRTYVWPTACKFAGGAAPTASTTAGYLDAVTFRFDGTSWLEVSRSVGVR